MCSLARWIRLVNHALRILDVIIQHRAISNFTVDPGVYAVVGAASMLGGVTHMVISLTVIVVECTNGLNLALPIMFALFVAKWVSSRFGHGLYDRCDFRRSAPSPWQTSPRRYSF